MPASTKAVAGRSLTALHTLSISHRSWPRGHWRRNCTGIRLAAAELAHPRLADEREVGGRG